MSQMWVKVEMTGDARFVKTSGIITLRRITPRTSPHPTYGRNNDIWLDQIRWEHR
ncbi:hypothetical protein [Marinomonas pollencensis]|uniref:Uncharacterized protein n=1 Tax=Marinomonas pollencensis TaxID=491954 RepID=A0A3E0D8Q4_9GAMM|nr:hypothetical protein [Marinomonas pollencensis]REG78465.1 hypothetical protein DFP81_12120 [Marinomonas pollencensis]